MSGPMRSLLRTLVLCSFLLPLACEGQDPTFPDNTGGTAGTSSGAGSGGTAGAQAPAAAAAGPRAAAQEAREAPADRLARAAARREAALAAQRAEAAQEAADREARAERSRRIGRNRWQRWFGWRRDRLRPVPGNRSVQDPPARRLHHRRDRLSGGYRVELFSLALAASKEITYLGGSMNGPTMVDGQTFPRNHEGHSGWTIKQIDDIVPDPALDETPHIILLHIGTNDMYGMPNGARTASAP